MFTDKDLELFKQRNVTVEQIEEQLNSFKKGFPFLKLVSAATVGNGILKMTEDDEAHYVSVWNEYLSSDGNILKFVPASGAASRMFKNLFRSCRGAGQCYLPCALRFMYFRDVGLSTCRPCRS